MRAPTINLPVRRPDIEVRDQGPFSIVYDPRSGQEHRLNATARAVWDLCDGATTLDELVDAVCVVFEVRRSDALRDIAGVLHQLEGAHLVLWSVGDRGDDA